MKRDLARLSDESFDLVIIGGGVYGLSAAWDAALRGLRVAVLEKGDFGAATSSGSLKLIHGGLRYLQHLNFARMRISINERHRMLRIAPHLVHPLEFVMPCYGHAMKGPEAMRLALLFNDLMSFDRNRGVDRAHAIPNGRTLSPAECLDRLPGIRREGLTGGAVFYDAQMHNSERLTLSFGLSAAEQGAALANYAEVTGFHVEQDSIRSVIARDRLSDRMFHVAGRLFLNLTGPWADITSRLLTSPSPDRRVVRSKGIQLVTRALPPAAAFPIESRQRDLTAVIKRGGRNYFVTPWRGLSILGTTDTLYEGSPDEFAITEADIGEFLAEINALYPAGLERKDVRFWIGGMRPLGDEDTNPEHAKASHKSQIRDHAREGGPSNLISAVGVKYTVCRHIAENLVDLAVRRLGAAAGRCRTRETPLAGGDTGDFESFLAESRRVAPAGTSEHLARNYGTRLRSVLALVSGDPSLARPLADSTEVLRAEVVHAVREEMAMRLDDVVLRRTGLGTLGHPGRPTLEECARLMAAELGWSPARQADELAAVERVFTPPAG
ncbi:MAG TPA: glycerol-3-phosphate dehydrogenase/oxidase [Kiritimatiellia bacterium]|nr:glycerol-3-phosphate dehydrogenase/oxidase [Kiritimatiellia bacterium]HRZ11789.1 glycerol-3-phosphate dehydrogenase/oxidase [Kiritimatiellia bacterium]HSA17405.1 glycerol-3-phosphate dehydrogenase/oxidase [Kiritimatiellia bacterium]